MDYSFYLQNVCNSTIYNYKVTLDSQIIITNSIKINICHQIATNPQFNYINVQVCVCLHSLAMRHKPQVQYQCTFVPKECTTFMKASNWSLTILLHLYTFTGHATIKPQPQPDNLYVTLAFEIDHFGPKQNRDASKHAHTHTKQGQANKKSY